MVAYSCLASLSNTKRGTDDAIESRKEDQSYKPHYHSYELSKMGQRTVAIVSNFT